MDNGDGKRLGAEYTERRPRVTASPTDDTPTADAVGAWLCATVRASEKHESNRCA